MYKINDYVVYRKEVCLVKNIVSINNEDYYILVPINDKSLTIKIPISNKNGYLRKLLTKEEIDQLIITIPSIKESNLEQKLIEGEYKNLLSSNKHEDLIKIIKTTYLRNKARKENNKKIGDRDEHYFNLAEKYLYSELAIVLNINYEEVKDYIIKRIEELNKINE